ncbi:hypothetical protein O181_109545 [Austropuccinia psidii MF-1]|uniref:Uncharacterized protein n=1 Tax=Austropuccinia psidii MF-1 TaxID=1389203 RepID=A0A9Q3JYN3_9BASI|nr:hypothetical protein [Austropuccinia psidii MF-1]
MKMLRKNRPAFAIGEEPLGKIKGNDIELYLDVERPYPPILRRPDYPESLETRKEIENISMNSWTWMSSGRLDIITPVLITPGRISCQSSAIDFTSSKRQAG